MAPPRPAQAHAALAERVETSGETVFFYLRDAKPLLDALADDHGIRYLHRPANLEDLFLKLTGPADPRRRLSDACMLVSFYAAAAPHAPLLAGRDAQPPGLEEARRCRASSATSPSR